MIHWKNVKRKGNPFQAAIKPAMLLPQGYLLTTLVDGEKVDVLFDSDYVREKIEAVIKPLNSCLTRQAMMALLSEIVDWNFPSGEDIKARETIGAVSKLAK
jgi:hypothetical protein